MAQSKKSIRCSDGHTQRYTVGSDRVVPLADSRTPSAHVVATSPAADFGNGSGNTPTTEDLRTIIEQRFGVVTGVTERGGVRIERDPGNVDWQSVADEMDTGILVFKNRAMGTMHEGNISTHFWSEGERLRRENTFGESGFNYLGRDRDGYDHKGNDFQGYDREGYREDRSGPPSYDDYPKRDRDGYTPAGIDSSGLNRDGIDGDGFNRAGFKNSFNREGVDNDGFDRTGFRDGINRDGIDTRGFNLAGLDSAGYDRAGFKDGYNRYGFAPDGFTAEGWNRNGPEPTDSYTTTINRETGTKFDLTGFNRVGRDADGYDRKGFNTSGFNRRGLHNRTKKMFDPHGYNQSGIDRSGFDRKGWNSRGLNKGTGGRYDRAGVNVDGFTRGGFVPEGTQVLARLPLEDGFTKADTFSSPYRPNTKWQRERRSDDEYGFESLKAAGIIEPLGRRWTLSLKGRRARKAAAQ